MLRLLRHVRPLAVGAFALGLALSAQAAPEMFAASFVWHAWSNDVSSGTADPYLDNYWSVAPQGFDCQHAEPYTQYGATNTRYCTPFIVMYGHPAAGKTYTTHGRGVAPSRDIGAGTPPAITMLQSDISVALSSYTTGLTWGVGQCCRGFLLTYPPYFQSFTYATFVNAAGSFFAGGGAAAPAGTGYNNHTGGTARNKGTWRIRAGKNAFGGAMGLLGLYGATGKYTLTAQPGAVFSGVSSWAMVPPLGRPLFNTVIGYTTMGKVKLYQNPYTKTDKWYTPGSTSTITAVGSGTLWTTGQVGAIVLTGDYYTSLWRTGYDNRTAGGKGNIQLVTPTITHWLATGGWVTHSAQTGILTILVPEPGAVLLLAAGGGLLGLLYWVSRRV